MSTEDAPVSPPQEQVTATPPPAGEERILLPPPTPPVPRAPYSPEKLARRVGVLEGCLVLLLLLVAFEVAAFRAGNTDVFRHLAAGRRVAEGNIASPDPFTFTARADSPWVNHAWLTDLVAYRLYLLDPDGIVLVALKAVLITLLAWLLLQTGSLPGRPRWIPAVCVLLAVLALSPRLLLQPVIVSYLLLGVTLFLLTRHAHDRGVWLLPVVCLLWVNLDEWFLLGPAAIALFLAGELLQKVAGNEGAAPLAEQAPPTRLGVILAVSLLACLVNPYHVHAFVLPPELQLSRTADVLGTDSLYSGLFVAPLEARFFHPTNGWSPTGLCFFVLLAAGVGSFALTAPRWRWSRITLFLAFTALALWKYRAIPFFAVVAGPITALNYLDGGAYFLGTELRTHRSARQWSIAGRVLTITLALVALLVGVPGWLHAEPHESRQLGFGIRINEGLRDVALRVKEWRDEGALPAEVHWFNTSPDVVNYFAWFCPGERAFLDTRIGLFGPDVARDYTAAQEALQGRDTPPDRGEGGTQTYAWRKVFAERGINFVAFHSPDLGSGYNIVTLMRMYQGRQEFTPCIVEGDTAIFAWKDPTKSADTPLDSRLKVNFDDLAFGPNAVQAPEQRGPTPGDKPWWQVFLPQPATSVLNRETAIQQLFRFDALGFPYAVEQHVAFRGCLAVSLIGTAANPGPAFQGLLMSLRMNQTFTLGRPGQSNQAQLMDQRIQGLEMAYRQFQDQGPPSALYLAVRAARQAQHDRPDDAGVHLALAQAYLKLLNSTREKHLAARLQHAESIRLTQVVAALQNALKLNALELNPRLEVAYKAHSHLIEVFSRQAPFFELYLKHSKELLRIARELHRQTGRIPGIPPEQSEKALTGLSDEVKRREQDLKTRQNKYELSSAYKTPLEKAQIALNNGLAETALDVLLKADLKDLEPEKGQAPIPGRQRVVELLLALGRLEDAREVLRPSSLGEEKIEKGAFGINRLGLSAYDWFEAQLAAASGDYAEADRAVGECIDWLENQTPIWAKLAQMDIAPLPRQGSKGNLATFAALLTGDVLLREAARVTRRQYVGLYPPTLPPHFKLAEGNNFLVGVLQQRTNLWAVRAWLSLEAGQIERARAQAHKVHELTDLGPGPSGRVILLLPSRPLADRVLQLTDPHAEGKSR